MIVLHLVQTFHKKIARLYFLCETVVACRKDADASKIVTYLKMFILYYIYGQVRLWEKRRCSWNYVVSQAKIDKDVDLDATPKDGRLASVAAGSET